MDCTIRRAKTKALISFAVTTKLICVFVFAYAKSRFSHDEAQMKVVVKCIIQKISEITQKLNMLYRYSNMSKKHKLNVNQYIT